MIQPKMSSTVSAFEIVVTLIGLKEDVSCPNPSQSLVRQLKCGGEMENEEMQEEMWS